MSKHKIRKFFVETAVSPAFVGEAIAKHNAKKNIGAHSIFLGQVRNDMIDGKNVKAIIYTAYKEMADEKLYEIRREAFVKFPLTCLHIYHSLGEVMAGEICLFIFTSSEHRKAAIEACNYILNRVKEEVPVWGKEIFEDENYSWKQNK